MKLSKWCFLVLFVMVFLLSGCTSTTSNVENDDKQWTTFSADAYEFEYPSSWVIADPTELGIEPVPEVVIYATASPNDDFLANVTMGIEVYPFFAPSAKEQADSATEWMQLLEGTTGISNYRQINFTPYKIGGVQAGISKAEYTISQNGIVVRNQQLIAPLGQQSYILTLTCKKDDWSFYEADFRRIIESFNLK